MGPKCLGDIHVEVGRPLVRIRSNRVRIGGEELGGCWRVCEGLEGTSVHHVRSAFRHM